MKLLNRENSNSNIFYECFRALCSSILFFFAQKTTSSIFKGFLNWSCRGCNRFWHIKLLKCLEYFQHFHKHTNPTPDIPLNITFSIPVWKPSLTEKQTISICVQSSTTQQPPHTTTGNFFKLLINFSDDNWITSNTRQVVT